MTKIQTVSEVKPVKQAFVIKDGYIITVVHYGTIILEIDTLIHEVLSINRASRTSSKMINRVLDHYGFSRNY